MAEIGKMGILAPFSPRLHDLGVIFVGIDEAHVHTYFGHFSLVLSSFRFSCHFWPCLTELAVLAETGQNMAGWLLICSLSYMTIPKHVKSQTRKKICVMCDTLV